MNPKVGLSLFVSIGPNAPIPIASKDCEFNQDRTCPRVAAGSVVFITVLSTKLSTLSTAIAQTQVVPPPSIAAYFIGNDLTMMQNIHPNDLLCSKYVQLTLTVIIIISYNQVQSQLTYRASSISVRFCEKMEMILRVFILLLIASCCLCEITEEETKERIYGMKKCSGSGCPYTASWLAHVNLFRRIPWWLDSTKMEAASFNM